MTDDPAPVDLQETLLAAIEHLTAAQTRYDELLKTWRDYIQAGDVQRSAAMGEIRAESRFVLEDAHRKVALVERQLDAQRAETMALHASTANEIAGRGEAQAKSLTRATWMLAAATLVLAIATVALIVVTASGA